MVNLVIEKGGKGLLAELFCMGFACIREGISFSVLSLPPSHGVCVSGVGSQS